MAHLNSKSLVFILAVIGFSFSSAYPQTVAQGSKGRISGTVSDGAGAQVANARITVEGEGLVTNLVTSDDGSYEISLRAGLYRLRVNQFGFCPISRPPFVIEPSTDAKLDIVLIVCPIVTTGSIAGGRYSDEKHEYQPPYKEELLQLVAPIRPAALQVHYSHRSATRNFVTYMSTKASRDTIRVTVSYDFFTIYADEVRFNIRRQQLEASGNVTFDDSKQRVEADRVEIRFTAPKASVRIGHHKSKLEFKDSTSLLRSIPY